MQPAVAIWRHRACRALVLGLVFAMLAPGLAGLLGGTPGGLMPGSWAEAQQTQQTKGTSVIIRGNRRIETGTILSYMQLPTNRPVTAEDLNAAVRRLYDTGLFSDVRIVPSKNQLVVEVKENPIINKIAFEGNHKLKDADLNKIIQLRPRLPYTAAAAEADAQRIIETYRSIGRYGAKVEPAIIKRPENRVDLVFQIKEGPVTGVKSIDFVGNKAFSDHRLRQVIQTKESSWLSFLTSNDTYDPNRLELDKQLLRQFYLNHGYADFSLLSATAELAPDHSGFFITFTVDEGKQYSFGKFDVSVSAPGLKPDEFKKLLPDLKGKTYDAAEVDKISNKLTDLAGQKGFAFVQVRPRVHKDTKKHVISITFDLVEGSRVFVERIDIEGNTQTLDRVVRREMTLAEGDAFDARKIRESRSNIRALNFFKSVNISTEPGSAPDRAVLKVKVEEESTGSLSLGVGFASSVGPIGNVKVSERNFLGRGQNVSLQATASGDTQIYQFSFTEPRFLDRHLAVGWDAYYRQENRRTVSSYKVDAAGFRPRVGFPLSDDLNLNLHYQIQRQNLTAASDASTAIKADEGSWFSSSVGYELFYDRRNDPVEPTSGYTIDFNQDVAGLGGSSRYVKSSASAKTWFGFFNKQVIASVEVEGGTMFTLGQDSRVTERFGLGGDTFRGFRPDGLGPRDLTTRDALRGNYYAISRFQVSFPLGLPKNLGIYGGFYVDAGSLWGLDKTSFPGTNIDASPHLRVAMGPMLFMDTPFGPLQISLGFPVVEQKYDQSELFRLSVGTRF